MRRHHLFCVLFATLPLNAALSSLPEESTLWASPPTIVRVEEDWELVVGNPDANSVAPQATAVFSPDGTFESLYGAFEINHRSLPSFQAGGLQVQICNGDSPVTSQSSSSESVISSPSEQVSWTQAMTLVNGQLTVEVLNGTSTTWGAFGEPGALQASTSTTLTSLNSYSPEFSCEQSGVGYAGNRVQSMVLKRVRLITSTGEVLEDTTSRTAFPKG